MPERQLSNLFLEQSNDLIWIIDSKFCLKYANQAYQNVMQQVTGEEKKMDEPIFIEGFGEGYIEKWKAYYERGLNGEHFEIEEHFYNSHTKQVEYSQISFKPIIDENQVVLNVACQSRDITSFIKSNTEAEKLLDASLDVICSIDAHGNFTKVSAACKELWGYEKHELIGKAYISFVIEEDIEKTNLVAADILDGKLVTTFENRYKRKDGDIAFNLWSAKWDPKTQIMFCVARDAREKIKKDELLIESENRFKALVQEGTDLIAILDEAGIYTYVSPTSIGLLGMAPEEFVGKSPFDYIHPEDAEKTLNSLNKITSESRVEVEPFRFKNKNGEWRWIETVMTNMLDNPVIKGIVANSRDITEQIKIRNLLNESNQLARIGSWEVDLINNSLFWSEITHEIHETPENFKPQLSEAIHFYRKDFRELVNQAVNSCIETATPFDIEAIIITNNNNEVWVRAMGRGELMDGKCARIFGSFQDINTLKLAELNQLKLIEEKSKILESIGDAFFTMDKNWVVTYWNNVAEKLFQKSKIEIVGKNLWDVYPESIESDSYTKYHYAMKTMETQSFEIFIGLIRQWLEVTAYPSEDGLSVYFKDITLSKKANEEIAKSEEKRRLIMNGALDAIISIDTNETITFWNPQAEVIFGWKAEEVMGKPLFETIIPEPFRKYHVEGINNYLKTGKGKALNVLLELSAIRRNGEEFPIELTVIPIKQGSEEFFCAFVRDITKRKKSEAAQIMAEKNYQELFDKSNDAIYVHDLDTGQITDVNYRATELTGFDKMDFLEKEPSILFTDNPEYTMEKAISYVQKAARGKPQVFDWLAKKKDGTSGWFEMTLKRTSIAGVDKILAFQRDIAERKKAEKELLELNNILKAKLAELETAYEELEQFAYIASHDLQEPLRMITSFMDQLKRKYNEQLDNKAHQYIEFAIDGAKRMKQIILDLLEYSRAGKILEEPQNVDINQILDEYKILRRKVITEKQVVFETGELPIITTYNTPLVQVVHNLIDNAIKYSKNDENPVVKITCIDRKKFWEFCIEDNGIGIDEKFFSQIFVIFQRLHDRNDYSGTGIGLSIVKKQIESLGGKIRIESKVNIGSKFYFTIPK